MLRAIAYGWQQEAVAEDAQRVSDLGRSLYESIRRLAEHFDELGGRLKSSLDAYNRAVGSLEGNVLVKARKFRDLPAAAGADEIPAIEAVDRTPRMLQAPELTDALPFAEASEPVDAEPV
jgi:DNA recombination protein RmuC